jgi:hypothetical protein
MPDVSEMRPCVSYDSTHFQLDIVLVMPAVGIRFSQSLPDLGNLPILLGPVTPYRLRDMMIMARLHVQLFPGRYEMLSFFTCSHDL